METEAGGSNQRVGVDNQIISGILRVYYFCTFADLGHTGIKSVLLKSHCFHLNALSKWELKVKSNNSNHSELTICGTFCMKYVHEKITATVSLFVL